MAHKIFVLVLLICTGYSHAAPYGGPVGLVSSAGSSSNYSPGGMQARANVGTLSSGNNADYAVNADTSSDDNSGYSQGSSSLATNSARVSSGGSGFSGGLVTSDAGSQGIATSDDSNIAVPLPINPANSGVQVLNVNQDSINNIGFQIQNTVRSILQQFGIQMNQNLARSTNFAPGNTYYFTNNGVPVGSSSQSQFQYMGGNGAGSMASSQVSSGGGPIRVSYKYIGQPQAAVAFQVSSGGYPQSGYQGDSGRIAVPNGQVTYTGVRPQITVTSNGNDQGYVSGGNNGYSGSQSNAGGYGGSQAAAYSDNGGYNDQQRVVVAPQPVQPVGLRTKTKFAQSQTKRTESTSNIAFEQETEK